MKWLYNDVANDLTCALGWVQGISRWGRGGVLRGHWPSKIREGKRYWS